MAVWSKIWQGIKVFGGAIKDAISYGSKGAEYGEMLGPEGAVIGAIGGAIVGLASNAPKIYDFVTADEEPTVSSIHDRIGGQASAAISYAAANPNDPASKVIANTLLGVQNGATWRSAYHAAGGHAFGRALQEGQIQGIINKAASELGVSPTMAMAHGNGAFRSMLSKTAGQTNVFQGSVADHIMGSSYVVAGSALASKGYGSSAPAYSPSGATFSATS